MQRQQSTHGMLAIPALRYCLARPATAKEMLSINKHKALGISCIKALTSLAYADANKHKSRSMHVTAGMPSTH
jgi:hypothetical protein